MGDNKRETGNRMSDDILAFHLSKMEEMQKENIESIKTLTDSVNRLVTYNKVKEEKDQQINAKLSALDEKISNLNKFKVDFETESRPVISRSKKFQSWIDDGTKWVLGAVIIIVLASAGINLIPTSNIKNQEAAQNEQKK